MSFPDEIEVPFELKPWLDDLQRRLKESTVNFRSKLQLLFDDLLYDPNIFSLLQDIHPKAIQDLNNVLESYHQILTIYKETMNNATKEKISHSLDVSEHSHISKTKHLPKFPRLFEIVRITKDNVEPLVLSVRKSDVPPEKYMYTKIHEHKWQCQICKANFTKKAECT